MAMARVVRTRDRRWRAEVQDDGLANLYERGHLVLRRATLDQVAQRLAERGVSSDDLVED